MPEPLACLPSTFAAGHTVAWTHAVASEYAPGGDWTVKTYFRGAGSITITADDASGTWTSTITATGSGALAAGTYAWATVAERTVADVLERQPLAQGTVTVTPNLITAVAGELVSPAARALAAIDAVIEGRLTDDVAEYTIGSRSVKTIPIMELVKLRGAFAARVAAERGAPRIRTHRAVVYGP